jgi:hypothetical protein
MTAYEANTISLIVMLNFNLKWVLGVVKVIICEQVST